MLGFAPGVMLAASFFSLTIPGLEVAKATFVNQWLPAIIIVGGVLLGAAFVGYDRVGKKLEKNGRQPEGY